MTTDEVAGRSQGDSKGENPDAEIRKDKQKGMNAPEELVSEALAENARPEPEEGSQKCPSIKRGNDEGIIVRKEAATITGKPVKWGRQ